VKRALNTTAGLTSRIDFNHDGKVNALDLGAAKANLNRSLNLTNVSVAGALATPPASRPFADSMVALSSGMTATSMLEEA